MKKFSDLELKIMAEGTQRIILELQQETKKNYPESVKIAIQNELQQRYKWYDAIREEQERRLERMQYI